MDDAIQLDFFLFSSDNGCHFIASQIVIEIRHLAGIKIRDYRNRTDLHNGITAGKEKFLELQDAPSGSTAFARFDFADLTSDGNVRIDFWKAKAFGVHTFMIRHTFPLEAMKGKDVTFTWRE